MVLRCWSVGAETMAPTGMDGVEDWDGVLEEEMESCNAAVEPIASESCCGGVQATAAARNEMAAAEARVRAKP